MNSSIVVGTDLYERQGVNYVSGNDIHPSDIDRIDPQEHQVSDYMEHACLDRLNTLDVDSFKND